MSIRASIFALLAGLHQSGSLDAAPTADQMRALVRSRPELDEIRWRDPARAPLKVRILQADPRALTVEKTLPAGLTVRTVPFSELSGVSFTFTKLEQSLHDPPAAASVPPLRVYWELRKASLSLPGSNAAETGLALARSLRLAADPSGLDEASAILEQIRNQELLPHRVDLAKAEQTSIDFIHSSLRDKPEETEKLAWEITENPQNVDAMLLATAFLAQRHFNELKTLESLHPRWIEDDDVRPVRERVYHLSLDFALYPSLFAGNRVAEASSGLKLASEIYQFTGLQVLCKNTLEDLAALYPDSPAAAETASELARLRQLDAAGELSPIFKKKSEDETSDGPSPEEAGEVKLIGPPPPPKRYNIFGD
jgi:hypothetical protein